MKKKLILKVKSLIFFVLFGFLSELSARTLPELTGPIVDNAGVVSSSEFTAISSSIRNYYKNTGVQFQILTLRSLEGESIEVFSIRLAEKWKIGGVDGTGVIIVAAIEDRQIRIEVGNGLEGELTDVFSSRIIRQLIAPQFRQGKYGLGFAAALSAMSGKLGSEIVFSDGQLNDARNYHHGTKKKGFSFFWLIILVFVFRGIVFRRGGGGCLTGFLLGSLLGGGRSYGGGGGFSAGGWSGGGGGFSGGGASGGW